MLATTFAALPVADARSVGDGGLLALGDEFFELEAAGREADRIRGEAECAAEKEFPERPSIYQQVRTESFEPGVPDHVRMERWGSLKQRSLDHFYGQQLDHLTGPRWAEVRSRVERERDGHQAQLDAYEAECRAIDERHNVPALERAFSAAEKKTDAAFDAFLACPATTFDGLAVKLRAADMYRQFRDLNNEDLWWPDLLLASVMNDIGRQGGAA